MNRKIAKRGFSLIITFLVLSAIILVMANHFTPKGNTAPILSEEEMLSQSIVEEKKDEEVSMIAVGDISYSRAVERIVARESDINYPFAKIGDYLRSADFVFGNLETPITPGENIPNYSMMFRSNPGTEQALKNAGIAIVSLANNHTPNFGQTGLRDTFKYLHQAGIKYVGAGKDNVEAFSPVYLEEKGIRFAFLAYNDDDVVPASYEATSERAGTAFMRIDKMIQSVAEAKSQADVVIVSMHSGNEYVENPNTSQTTFARAAIDAGADIVIGHHPHVVQTMERYKDKYIFYSLGNFIFDQPQMQETLESLLIKIYFSKDGVKRIVLTPAFMEKLAQPKIVQGEKAEKIIKRLQFPFETQDISDADDDMSEKAVQYVIH